MTTKTNEATALRTAERYATQAKALGLDASVELDRDGWATVTVTMPGTPSGALWIYVGTRLSGRATVSATRYYGPTAKTLVPVRRIPTYLTMMVEVPA